MDDPPIRDASTVILVRDATTTPKILMGQRAQGAVFMPNKVVFPGGGIEQGDVDVELAETINMTCANRLSENRNKVRASALCSAAIRELFEETGQVLGRLGDWKAPNPNWADFAKTGNAPSAHALYYVYRAITPPGRPRRFDARFFLANAADVTSELDDFSSASDELSHLDWYSFEQIETLDLPLITTLVLSTVRALLPRFAPPPTVPFRQNR